MGNILDYLVIAGKCAWGIIALYVLYKIFTMEVKDDEQGTIPNASRNPRAPDDSTHDGL